MRALRGDGLPSVDRHQLPFLGPTQTRRTEVAQNCTFRERSPSD
jgi:hypothetical protein